MTEQPSIEAILAPVNDDIATIANAVTAGEIDEMSALITNNDNNEVTLSQDAPNLSSQ